MKKETRFQKLTAEKRTICEDGSTCEFHWHWFYVPRSQPQFLHVMEANADSAAVLLSLALNKIDIPEEAKRQLDLVFDRLNRIKGGCRKIIMELPAENIQRCQVRKSKRERCHMPLHDGECADHGDQSNHTLEDFF